MYEDEWKDQLFVNITHSTSIILLQSGLHIGLESKSVQKKKKKKKKKKVTDATIAPPLPNQRFTFNECRMAARHEEWCYEENSEIF